MTWSRKGFVVGILIFLLNSFDGLMTMAMLATGHFKEANPLMAYLIASIGSWFLLPKILLGGLAAAVIATYWKTSKLAKIGGSIVLAIYVAIIVNHIVLFIWLKAYIL